MRKLTKKDFIYLGIIIAVFIILVLALTNGVYLYGSQLDWYGEHIAIPEYFRTLFYDTKELLPDFAFNIGSGQNIYNLSYYGLLSPIILISYLMPKVSMTSYIVVSTIVCVLLSAIMMYLFLKKKKISSEACFIASLIFVLSSPMSLHSHRHIMFINYMPFVILGFFGIDKKEETNKGWLIAVSVFLMVMTSYYYSIGGIVCLCLYALYKYLMKMNKVTAKSFFKALVNILVPIMVGVMCSAIITLPTLATLVNNRASSNVVISLKDLLLPSINTSNILYSSYGLGLTAIIFVSIINLFKENKAKITLGIILAVLVIFNLCNYVLNGTMYIDSKSLIPFLPLYIYTIALFIDDLFNKKVNYKVMIISMIIISVFVIFKSSYVERYFYDLLLLGIGLLLYKLSEKKLTFIVPVLAFVIIHSFAINFGDELVLKYMAEDQENLISSAVLSVTDTDKGKYRISNELSNGEYADRVFNNIDYNLSTIYSSISNQNYNSFYYDTLANNIATRNRVMTITTPNLLGLMLTGNKYVVSMNGPLIGYEEVSTNNGLNVYKNEAVLPLGFATSNVMSYEDYDKLSYGIQQEALLNVIVADTKTSNDFVPHMEKVNFDYQKILKNEQVTTDEDGHIIVKARDNLKIKYELPEKYHNKILLIRFKMNESSSDKDLSIKINSVKNKLTANTWKYYNNNEIFDYVLASQNQKELVFNFTDGDYNLSDFETYVLDYAYIEQVSKKVSRFIIDDEQTKGDKIVGSVNALDDGYFMLSVPYDKGFTIKVDGNKVNYENVDGVYIGFKITKGNHHIDIVYDAPMKKASCVISSLGIVVFAVITYLESKRKI